CYNDRNNPRSTATFTIILHSGTSLYILFFFSSRRRHTRSKRDWSSDVCSSDLKTAPILAVANWVTSHSNLLSDHMATRSLFLTPIEIKALAASSTNLLNS